MFANNFGGESNVCCGLAKIVKNEGEWQPPIKSPVPLISVNVNASLVHAVAQVEVEQVYVNKEDQPIEAIYYFPVNPDGAVTHFQAELEGRVIKGTVKPHEEAEEAYNNAIEQQTTAFLGEETKSDIFKVRVGFLKPGTQVKVIIGYVTEVKNEPGTNTIRFYIPTTVAPRYVSPSESGNSKAEDIKNMAHSLFSPAPLTLKVAVSLQGGVKSIKSPTHNVKVDRVVGPNLPENGNWHKAIVELSGKTTDMDRDFVLNIVPEESSVPKLYTEKAENGSTACMIQFIPSFKLDEQRTELIFILDRSASMGGESINLARRALLLFLHSMPADCYFNIVGFGSTHEFLFQKSVKYDDGTLTTAIEHARVMTANLGGTEIFQPLREIYEKPGIRGYLRQLFILTDGQVSDTERVIGIARANARKARVFALGIGSGSSHGLVEGVAKAGGGTSAFVTYNESIDKKVLNQLKNGLQPSLTDIELEWEGITSSQAVTPAEPVPLSKKKTLMGYNKPMKVEDSDDSESGSDSATKIGKRIKQSPKNIPPVYDGSQMLVFGLFRGDESPNAVTIKAQSPDGPLTLRVKNTPGNDVGQTGMLHRLAAIKLVRELELELSGLDYYPSYRLPPDAESTQDNLKREIIEIGCEYGITSKFTSFVAIDTKDDKPFTGDLVMQTRHVPSQLPEEFGNLGSMLGNVLSKDLCENESRFDSIKGCVTKAKSGSGFNLLPKIAKGTTSAFSSLKSSLGFKTGHSIIRSSTARSQRAQFNYCRSVSSLRGNLSEETVPSPVVVGLVSLQSFDGSFQLNEQFASVIGKSMEGIKDEAARNNLGEEVFATALAVSHFELNMSTEKDLWELVVMKARKWLAKQVEGGQKKVEDIVQIALAFLNKA